MTSPPRTVHHLLGPAFIICVTGLLCMFAEVSEALQVWPETELKLMAADKGVDRGLLISDEPGYGAGVSVGMEPFDAELAWMRYSGSWDSRVVRDHYSYRADCLLVERPMNLSIGLAGDMFGAASSPEFKDRHELVLSLRRALLSVPSLSLECEVRSDIENDMALYASLSCEGTLVLSDSVDLDYALRGGVGDSAFASGHTDHLGGELSDSWSDGAVLISLPMMVGPVDVVPSVSHLWVIDSEARGSLKSAGVERELWQFSLSVVFYFD